ncbi:MAG: hypothetical protein CMH13_11075 [Martelella sp.]|uniref:hypothetical protein n=1 Tax=unclassified Martelella TaxID=2629616 RepID=UPI000C6BB0B0|nr:hypothetical protein [Martelella sp.]MAU21061.1 hypothetical protein [Martelella sp.]|tara:strand:- start:6621 stop:6884 length:264 start_codon:yes stop_codon:yes gene_type:complete
MTDGPCDLHEGFTLAYCTTCRGTEAHDDFACADWARRLADHAMVEHVAAFLREMRAILPEVEITAEQVARKFAIGVDEAAAIMQKAV